MKTPFYLSSVVALLFTVGTPMAASQDTVAGLKPVDIRRYTPQGNLLQFGATTIVERKDPTELTGTPRGKFLGLGVMHLEGDVEITIFKKSLVSHPSSLDEMFTKEMILTADQADYDPKTGKIKPQGHVAIKFQNLASSAK